MTHITCRLTAKNRDQLRNPTLSDRVWATFTFFVLFRSQADMMLSQDSTYQGDRAGAGFYQSQPLSQPGFFPASQY